MVMTRILVIDDEQASCRTLKLHFEDRGFQVETAGDAEEGLAFIKSQPFDLVISDIRMPGRDGLSLLKEVRELLPELPFIMITAFQDLDSTVAAMRGGAVDYVPKPIDLEELEAAVDKAVIKNVDQSSDDILLALDDKSGIIVGRSPGIQDVFKLIGIASQNRVNVLIQGEPATGKEAVARAIHDAGIVAAIDKPFVTVNCSSSDDAFLEGELFGCENGDSSGAIGSRPGQIGLVGEGTLFVDEVNVLSAHLQGKLLRLLEDNQYTPVGGARPINAACRFILASNEDLAQLVAVGRFREDLYYRLGAFTIAIPPLRERREDIPLLIERLINKINREAGKIIRRVPSDCMDVLVAYGWPGNVRQLENILMKAIVIAPGDALSLSLLPEEIISGKQFSSSSDFADEKISVMSLKELEREHIHSVLIATGWHKGKACKILGISRPRLERRIDEFGFVRNA
ncbi:MAG: sigma-54-dependent Fis family transcriptional regulator [Rhodospirillales bacterium]|nr:sigma-54-dependent Fis family transcriptional regulator [Rhodospirillales bacterium]